MSADSLAGIIDLVAAGTISEASGKTVLGVVAEEGGVGFFVGQVMERSGGKADPKRASEVLRRALG